MQTSRFQLGLIATLAVGLGFSLSSSEAVGYPAGAAVSLASNPLVSATGTLSTSAVEVFASSEDQQLILTDILITKTIGNSDCSGTADRTLRIETGSGETLALIGVGQPSVTVSTPGIPVPLGESVTIKTNVCATSLRYLLTGYYAQP
jgi:hypothetical protein